MKKESVLSDILFTTGEPSQGGDIMHKRDWLHRASPRQFVNHIHEIEGISQPLSEHEILEVQEKFLSNGFQYIKFSSIEEGRSIIEAFLQTLPLYHDVACLTTQTPP